MIRGLFDVDVRRGAHDDKLLRVIQDCLGYNPATKRIYRNHYRPTSNDDVLLCDELCRIGLMYVGNHPRNPPDRKVYHAVMRDAANVATAERGGIAAHRQRVEAANAE